MPLTCWGFGDNPPGMDVADANVVLNTVDDPHSFLTLNNGSSGKIPHATVLTMKLDL